MLENAEGTKTSTELHGAVIAYVSKVLDALNSLEFDEEFYIEKLSIGWLGAEYEGIYLSTSAIDGQVALFVEKEDT